MKVSVLTIVRGRKTHLHNQLKGLLQSNVPPSQWVIVGMNEDVSVDLPADAPFSVKTARVNGNGTQLPLAEARNLAASLCETAGMVFLDVDCIPSPTMIAHFQSALRKDDGLWMGNARYLPLGAAREGWQMADIQKLAVNHPLQPTLNPGELMPSKHYELFWSLCFAISKIGFEKVGGFDDSFDGYGGEDTDFAFAARQAGIPFGFVGATAYHQHHSVCKPPLNHFNAIVRNAIRFHQKWNVWPMGSWLEAFAELELVRFDPDANELMILEEPTHQMVQQAETLSPAGF
ncbi:Glycosyltransferase, GT2 family [Neorhodopirellula lusitana]|uniref:Glycosyltransferase, GT2 family n=1 Tax=Neorhodopirellula lusitana TaxID=445327 RepID=A0ABY1QRB2_9BACT|nr:galactosyltransferase-related protein [Neorhodopirellula lusitana]SMP75487.1 Glycosyltransferase, GT2 family [Neorhodopirellula lusitana]